MYDKSFLFSWHTDIKGIQKLRPYKRRLTKSLRKIILKCVLIKINLLNLMSYVKVSRNRVKNHKEKVQNNFSHISLLKISPNRFFRRSLFITGISLEIKIPHTKQENNNNKHSFCHLVLECSTNIIYGIAYISLHHISTCCCFDLGRLWLFADTTSRETCMWHLSKSHISKLNIGILYIYIFLPPLVCVYWDLFCLF